MENASQVQPLDSRPVWKRGLFMLLIAIAFSIGQMALNIITIVQFFWLLVLHERNEYLARTGALLANWFAEAARFQSGATEDKPFPWRPWP